MKKILIPILGLCLFLVSFIVSENIYAISNTISGTLKDSSSSPIITKIELVNGQNIYSTTSSKIDGSYSLSVPTNWYILKFSSVNQTANMPRLFEVEKNVTVSSSAIQNITPPISTITVNIKDSSNSPIQGAILDSGTGQINLGGFTGTEEDKSVTDSSGNVVLHLLPATFSNVKIILPNGNTFFPASGRTLAVSGSASYSLSIPSNPTVSGTIKDSSNNPIRTIIELVSGDYVERTQTDSSGAYSFSVPTGDYTIKFSQLFTNQTNLPKYFDVERQVTISGSSTQNLVAPILTLTGNINKTSMPIKVKNVLSNAGFEGFSLDSTTTDSSGNFAVKLIQSTSSQITIQINGTGLFYSCHISASTIICP